MQQISNRCIPACAVRYSVRDVASRESIVHFLNGGMSVHLCFNSVGELSERGC